MRSTEVPIREMESVHCSEFPFEPFKHVPRPHPDKWGSQVATYRKWPSAPGTHVCSASHSWLLGPVPARHPIGHPATPISARIRVPLI